MGVIVAQLKVFVVEVEDALHGRIDVHLRQGARLARELQLHLLQVVEVDVGIAQGVDKVAGAQPRDLGHHLQQQGIGGDVERHAQEDVGTALVELQAQPPVGYIELEEGVAGRQVHPVQVGYVPGAYDDAPRVGIGTDGLYRLADLVDAATPIVGPGAPLVAVDVAQVAVGAGPLVPDAYAMLLQVLHVGVALQEPEQFVDDGFQMELLGGEAGEAVVQMEAHLMAEDTDGARSGAVALFDPFGQHAVEQV